MNGNQLPISSISDEEPEGTTSQPSILQKPLSLSEKEKIVLLDVVEHYKDIVASSKTDITSVKKKFEAWERIRKDFSLLMRNGVNRTSSSLKTLWENLQKPELTNDKQQTPNNPPEIITVEDIAETPQTKPDSEDDESWLLATEIEIAELKKEQELVKLELLRLEVRRKTAELYRDFPHLNDN